MRTLFRWATCAIAAVVLAAMLWSPAASADTLKNKQTGEVIKGTLTNQKINGRNIFKLDTGGTKLINPDEWQAVQEAGAPPIGAAPMKPTAPAAPPLPTTTLGYIIPINGPILTRALIEAVEKAIGEARTKGATVVIFRMNTPGGRLDLGDEIIHMIEKIDWATTVAWVSGDLKEALSLGAYISLSTHKIYLAPGTTIGAATPYSISTGSAKVDEKMISAFRARFRSLCEQRGHEKAVADAMVDGTTSLVEAWMDGKKTVVTADDAKRLEEQYKGNEGKFKRGRTINEPGKPITLTCQEALDYGISNGIAADENELMAKLGYDRFQTASANWLLTWVEKVGNERKAKVEKLRTEFNMNFEKALATAPQTSGGAWSRTAWTTATDKALEYLQECARTLNEIEKLSKDKRYDLPIPQEAINDMKVNLEGLNARLQKDRVPGR